MKNNFTKAALFAATMLMGSTALATPLTTTSPFGKDVTTVGATTVGGIVVHLVGANGANVISQLAASSLYQGFFSGNPGAIGTQAGFNSAITSALGGGLQGAAFRFTLNDGDTGIGDFDFNKNTLLVNDIDFGNWSQVTTNHTDQNGNMGVDGQGQGFRNNLLDTGWFSSSDTTTLQSLFASLVSSQSLVFGLNDQSPNDNYYDFTQGLDGSVINVGQGPVVTPGEVPEPMSAALFAIGLAGAGFVRRNARKQ